MRKKCVIIATIIIIFLLLVICSYYGVLFFTKGFNEFDYLFLNIVGDAVIVGIVTHISSKNIALFISKKEFDRNNKTNISINASRIGIMNYSCFLKNYENQDVFFALSDNKRDVFKNVYKIYNYLISTLQSAGLEKQLLDTILNAPFTIDLYEETNIKDFFDKMFKDEFCTNKYLNFEYLKELLDENDINNLQEFSEIMLKLKHYEISNLNPNEGCQLIVMFNNIVACKIPCLPNQKYDLYAYYENEGNLEFVAFSRDYNSKEYATNIMGMKYSNEDEHFKRATINLKDFVEIK